MGHFLCFVDALLSSRNFLYIFWRKKIPPHALHHGPSRKIVELVITTDFYTFKNTFSIQYYYIIRPNFKKWKLLWWWIENHYFLFVSKTFDFFNKVLVIYCKPQYSTAIYLPICSWAWNLYCKTVFEKYPVWLQQNFPLHFN